MSYCLCFTAQKRFLESEIDLVLIKTSSLHLRQASMSIKGEMEIRSTLFIFTFVSSCFN